MSFFFQNQNETFPFFNIQQILHCRDINISYMSIKIKTGFEFWYLMPLSTIFQLYRGGKFLLVEETRTPGENHRPAASH